MKRVLLLATVALIVGSVALMAAWERNIEPTVTNVLIDVDSNTAVQMDTTAAFLTLDVAGKRWKHFTGEFVVFAPEMISPAKSDSSDTFVVAAESLVVLAYGSYDSDFSWKTLVHTLRLDSVLAVGDSTDSFVFRLPHTPLLDTGSFFPYYQFKLRSRWDRAAGDTVSDGGGVELADSFHVTANLWGHE